MVIDGDKFKKSLIITEYNALPLITDTADNN